MRQTTLQDAQQRLAAGENVWVIPPGGLGGLIEGPACWHRVISITRRPDRYDDYGDSREDIIAGQPVWDDAWDIEIGSGEIIPVCTEVGWTVIGGSVMVGRMTDDDEAPGPVVFSKR